MCLSSRTRTMSRRSPRRRSSGSSGLDLTATVRDVSPMPPSPDVSANAPDAQRSSALGFLLRKKPMDGARVSTHGLADGKGPRGRRRVRSRPPRLRAIPTARKSVNTGNYRSNQPSRGSNTPGLRPAEVPEASARSRARLETRARWTTRMSMRLRPPPTRARDRAPMCRRPGSAPPRRWRKIIPADPLAWERCRSRAELLTSTAVRPFTPVKRSDNGVRISTPPTRPARTHGRTHAFEDGRRHRDPQAGRRRDIPQARSGRHRPLHRCATRRLPRKSQTRARGDERLLIPPRRVASRLPAPGSTRI